MAYKAVINDNYLCHVNFNHDKLGRFAPGDGDHDGQTEYRDAVRKARNMSRLGESSREARDRLDSYYRNEGGSNYKSSKTTPMGSSRSRNPYVDNNGNLTEAGERRFEAEKKANALKSKKNRVEDVNDLKDPNRWVREDIKNMNELARASKEASDSTSRLIDEIFPDKKSPKADLSSMSDQEIRQILNRERLEREYDDMFNPPIPNKGKEFVKKSLKVGSIVSSQAIAGLTIAGLIVALSA